MDNDDLKKNNLLDKLDKLTETDTKTGKRIDAATSLYTKAQTVAQYFMIAKFVVIGIVVIGLLYGSYAFVSGIKGMVTEAAVAEVKEVATEKYAEVKDKVKEKTKDQSVQSLSSAFVKFAKNVDSKINEAVGGALIENGFHPDAPGNCTLQSSDAPSSTCRAYTAAEISGSDYKSIKVQWTHQCPSVYANAMSKLRANGKITENDKRMLNNDCNTYLDAVGDIERDTLKQQLLDRAGI